MDAWPSRSRSMPGNGLSQPTRRGATILTVKGKSYRAEKTKRVGKSPILKTPQACRSYRWPVWTLGDHLPGPFLAASLLSTNQIVGEVQGSDIQRTARDRDLRRLFIDDHPDLLADTVPVSWRRASRNAASRSLLFRSKPL
jgi:hypothetical protein